MKNLVKVKSVKEEDVKNILLKLSEDEISRNLNFSCGHIFGVYYCDNLVGLVGLSSWYPDNLSITIALLNEYRGKGIAVEAINKLVFEIGKIFPANAKFLYNVSSNNISSLRVAKKLNWAKTSEFDEAMLDEGGEFFNIYYKDNPYYLNDVGKTKK